MKKISIMCFSFLVLILTTSCGKIESIRLTHCDDVVTDTAGTGDNGRVYMQNAFSPNSDGLNDVSRPVTYNIDSLVFTIYDQNNNVVFTTNKLGEGWKTTVNNNNFITYYFKIQARTLSKHNIGLCGELYKMSCFPPSLPRSKFQFEDQLLPDGSYSANSLETLPVCQ